MEMMTEDMGGPIPPLPDLVASLEQATLMAKQLPSTTDPTQILQIYSSLTTAHHHLSSFLSHHDHHHPPAENSVSSAVSPSTTANNMDAEPMQVGDNGEEEEEEEEEENSKDTIDIVEEQMRDCFIRNKRPKRAISPSLAAATERGRSRDDGFVRDEVGFDPNSTRLRSLDLIYQFHG